MLVHLFLKGNVLISQYAYNLYQSFRYIVAIQAINTVTQRLFQTCEYRMYLKFVIRSESAAVHV